MNVQVLSKEEINEVSGGLGVSVTSPFLVNNLDFNPAGIFTLVSSLLGSTLGLLRGLPLVGGLV